MPTKTEVVNINNVAYSITQWPADRALIMKFQLVRIAGPVLTQLLTKKETEESPEAVMMEAFVTVMSNTNASPEVISKFIQDCVTSNNVRVEGAVIDYAAFVSRFSGDDMADLYQLVGNVIKVNFAGLMKGPNLPGAGAKQLTGENTPT